MNITRILCISVCAVAAGHTIAAAADQQDSRPNIVLVLADDLGWTDLGCAGSPYYETPHIDRLAREGITLTSFTVCQNCAPTRAALMSGQYAPRTGIYTVGTFRRGRDRDRALVPPENRTTLPLEKITLAQALQQAGWATAMFGKWHLGHGPYHPSQRGFDEAVVSSGRHFDFRTDPKVPVPPGSYLADFLTDRAIDFLQRNRARPFFLYLPHFAVHQPLRAKEALIEKYRAKTGSGGHDNPVYAAMIESVDQSVGRILAALDELDLARKTLVIFSSDNGGVGGYAVPGTDQTKGTTNNAPLRGGKGTLYEGGIRVPFLARWPGVIQPGSTSDEPAVHVDLFPTLLDATGASVPPDYPLDGTSLLPLLRCPSASLDRDAIYAHFPGYLQAYIPEAVWRTTPVSTIRMGDWKLLEFLEDGRLELYNLRDDLGETHNLTAARPDMARQLHARLAAWRDKIGAAMPRKKTPAELAAPIPEVRIASVRRVFDNGQHNAFTDLCRFQDKYYLAFRSCPDGHGVHPTSSIIVLSSDDGDSWREVHQFHVAERDVRDPHFLVFRGKLFLYTGTWYCGSGSPKQYDMNEHLGYAAWTGDGRTWHSPVMLEGTYGHYVWRAASCGDKAYLCARRKHQFARTRTRAERDPLVESAMLESTDGLIWRQVGLFQQRFGDETAFLFEKEGDVLAVARSGGGRNAQICRSRPPYQQWQRQNLDCAIGGPLLTKWHGHYVVGGRKTGRGKATTALWWLIDDHLYELATLPSGGDNSYPGFVELDDTRALVSYYSSHHRDESDKTITAVYLADLRAE